jgi:hypothetical protein
MGPGPGVKSYAGGSACSASYGSDLATGTNCTDSGYFFAQTPDADADATTGWTNSGAATFDSVETGTPQQGSSHLYALSDTAGDHFYRDFSGLSASTMYVVSFYGKHDGTGGNWTCSLGSSHFSPTMVIKALTSSDTTYTQYKRYFYFATGAIADITCKATTTNGGMYLDAYSLKTATPCMGDELHTDANAASISNEADSVGSWTTSGTSTFDSVETDPQHGTSSLHMVANANNGYISLDLGSILTVGKKYFISWKVKQLGADSVACGFGGSVGTIVNTTMTYSTSSWTNPGYDITYATASHRYFTCKENGSNDNAEILLDSLSIKEITAE